MDVVEALVWRGFGHALQVFGAGGIGVAFNADKAIRWSKIVRAGIIKRETVANEVVVAGKVVAQVVCAVEVSARRIGGNVSARILVK